MPGKGITAERVWCDMETVMPESAGVKSEDVIGFIDGLKSTEACMHSFIMVRHGKVFAEGYWKPIKPDMLHRMYSISKSFVSAAIGMLVGEGRISLDDRVVSYFPDKVPETGLYPYVADITIRDLLIMATPYTRGASYSLRDKDWTATFFASPSSHPAGTIFNYDTSASLILNVIVERVTGMPFLEYMRKGLLDPIGFSRGTWCVKAPEGCSWGGSGVMATTRDLARFALVFLNKGCYNGKQLIPEDYVRAATSRQIDNDRDQTGERWNCGYGYQIWILKGGAFAFRGMGSQLAICVPEKDFLFVCTADTQGSQYQDRMIYELLWRHIIDNMAEPPASHKLSKTRMSTEAFNVLQKRCAALEFEPIKGKTGSGVLKSVNGICYTLSANPMSIKQIGIDINSGTNEGLLYYTNSRGDKKLRFGVGKYIEGGFPETHYFGDTIGKPAGREYRETSCAAWVEENKLMIRTFIIDDHLGNLTTTLSFKGDEIAVYMSKNAEFFLDDYTGFAGGSRI